MPEVQKVSGQNCNYKCRKVKLKDFLQFLDNIRSQKRLKDFPQYANPNLYICQSKHFFILQVTEFKDKWFKECSPIFDEKCKTK